MKTRVWFLLVAVAVALRVVGQPQVQPPSSEILQGIKKLGTIGSVLYIAAHPDDENTRLLAYLANEKKVRTAYLSLTRGDGGQNLIGKEQGEALGLLRTQELLAARRTDGAEQFFTRANDFGFSKNPDETFRFWNRDSILSDVVLAIRRFKPDIIICRFPTTGEGGHGHHTASAILAGEAFEAAANPLRFAEQLAHTQVWQAKSLYWNTFNFGGANTTAPTQLKIDVGLYNPLLGKSYGELAAESRSQHRSQGFGSLKQRGQTLEYFKFLKGDSATRDLFDNVDLSWKRVSGGESVQQLIQKIGEDFDPAVPENSVEALGHVYEEIKKLPAADDYVRYWKQQKLKETERLLLACAGLWLEALAGDYVAIPGQTFSLTLQVLNRSKVPVLLTKIDYCGLSDSSFNLGVKANELYTFKRQQVLPSGTPFSNPYWLNAPKREGIYTVPAGSLIGKPENEPALKVTFYLQVGTTGLVVERPLLYKYSDPAKGEIYRPLEVLPPVVINFSEKAFVFNGKTPKVIQVTVKSNAPMQQGQLKFGFSGRFSLVTSKTDFLLKNKGDEAVLDATLTPETDTEKGELTATAIVNGREYGQSIRRIEYDHIPYQFILSPASIKMACVQLGKTAKQIAYIPGAGDEVESCLKQVGYTVTRLSDEMLSKDDLQKYDAIVTGVRAYNTNERLQVQNQRLLDYVKNGGNLVVQYNTNSRFGPLQASIGPYPFTISRDRVTNENAVVKYVNANHPALNTPNKITEADFEDWVQERGIYFATELDKHYETILLMNDPGEKESGGSLITTPYGKGNFVYTGLVFFRQLPAAVPGAYRLFANLMALPKNQQGKK